MSNQNTIEKKDAERGKKSEQIHENQALRTSIEKQRLSEAGTDSAETIRPVTPRPKRIAALLGVILLGALYLITLIAAIFDKSSSGRWFLLCLVGTVAIPLLIWIYTWMYGVLTGRRTIASIEPADRRKPNVGKSDDANPETGKSQK